LDQIGSLPVRWIEAISMRSDFDAGLIDRKDYPAPPSASGSSA
jgi:hypothetical protein